MVAVISSYQLGLMGSETQHQQGTSSINPAHEQISVNVATGNLVINRRDEVLLGLSGAAEIVRVYNSQGQFDDQDANRRRPDTHL